MVVVRNFHLHVNPIIMSTAHHQAVEKCNSLEACEFMGGNLSGATPCVFSRNVAPQVAEVGSLFSRIRGSI